MVLPASPAAIATTKTDDQEKAIVPKTSDYPFFSEALGNEIVEIRVGPEKHIFRVHKAPLCRAAPYFQKIFNGGFQELTKKSASFPEDTVQAFEVFLEYAYLGRLHPMHEDKVLGTRNWQVYTAYQLANKLRAVRFMDRVMTTFIKYLVERNRFPGLTDIGKAYELLPKSLPLRDFACWSLHYIIYELRHYDTEKVWSHEGIDELLRTTADLNLDLIKRMRELKPGEHVVDPRKEPICTFHAHGPDEHCPDRRKE